MKKEKEYFAVDITKLPKDMKVGDIDIETLKTYGVEILNPEKEEQAQKYREIESRISKFYEEDKGDLCDIGLYIAQYFGYL